MVDVLELFLFCLFQATVLILIAVLALLCVMSVFPISGMIYHRFGASPFRGLITSGYFLFHLVMAFAIILFCIMELSKI